MRLLAAAIVLAALILGAAGVTVAVIAFDDSSGPVCFENESEVLVMCVDPEDPESTFRVVYVDQGKVITEP
jgi:hypothetical protein